MRLSQLLWCSWSYATEILCDDYEWSCHLIYNKTCLFSDYCRCAYFLKFIMSGLLSNGMANLQNFIYICGCLYPRSSTGS